MKKCIIAFFVFFLCFLALGCGSNSNGSTNRENTSRAPKAQEIIIFVDQKATISSSGNYVNLEGSIKNISPDKVISYVTLRYKAFDANGNVVDSQDIPVIGDIGPSEQKVYHSMANWNDNMKKYKIYVKTIKFK